MPPVTLLESMPDFKRAIAQNKLSVVDFFAAISPRFEKMAQDNTNAAFYKVNVDNLPDVAREYGVTAMPTFKLFKSGKLIDTIVGANVAALESKIKQHSTPAAFSGTGRTLGGSSSSSPTSPTSPSAPSPAASASTSAFAAFKSSSDTPTATAPAAAAQTNSTFVWIAVVFLLVYWYLGQRGAGLGKEGMVDGGYEF